MANALGSRTITCFHCRRELPRNRFPTGQQKRADRGEPAKCIDCIREENQQKRKKND